METRTLRATLHSGTTTAGNGTAATNPTGGGLILGTLSGSGAITASVVVEISAAGSVWVPLREPERINGAGSVPVQIYYSTTAAQVRLRVVDITGTLSVGLYAVGPEISTDLNPSPDGSTLASDRPIQTPNLPLSEPWVSALYANVFDVNAAGTTVGYYLNDSGVPVSAATTNISQQIPLSVGQKLIVISDADSYPTFRGCFFNADGTFHSTLISSPAHAASTMIFSCPAGAAYARVNYRVANLHYIGTERGFRRSGYKSISFIGDSNVAGGIGAFSDVAGVTTQMARLIGGGVEVRNRGVSNRRLSGVGGIAEAILTTDPDVECMVCLGGGNDHAAQVALGAADSANTAEFNGALNAICGYFQKRIWQKLFLCTFTERTGTELAIPVDDYNAAIVAAGVRWTVPVIDLRNLVGSDPDMSAPAVKLFYPDGKHWSWLMQNIAANEIVRRIYEG